jgi:hypothetical protein
VGAALVELLDELGAARATAVDRATPAGPAHEFVQADLGSDAAAYLDGVNVPVDAGMQAALLTDQTDYDPDRRTTRTDGRAAWRTGRGDQRCGWTGRGPGTRSAGRCARPGGLAGAPGVPGADADARIRAIRADSRRAPMDGGLTVAADQLSRLCLAAMRVPAGSQV